MALNLSVEEIHDLLKTYYAELNKNQFQREQIISAIASLEQKLKTVPSIVQGVLPEVADNQPAVVELPAEEKPKRGRKPGPKATQLAEAEVAAEPKKRGRKPGIKAEVAETEVAAEPKKRGRKPGIKAEVAETEVSAEPKKRGRKPGFKAEVAVTEVSAEPKKRGRKPGFKAEVAVTEVSAEPKKRGRKPGLKSVVVAEADVTTEPKKRGRKPGFKAEAAEVIDVTAATPKTRGRKPGFKANDVPVTVVEPVGGGRKKSKPAAEAPAKRMGRAKGDLSEWDQIAMDLAKASKEPITRTVIDEAFRAKVNAENLGWSENKLYQKTSSVLIKLVDGHKLLEKVDIKGRGFAYKVL